MASSPMRYSEAVDRAAIVLLAMSYRPSLRPRLIREITTAVKRRGGQIDGLLVRYDLRAVCEEVADRALTMLSVILRDRMPGIADEMDAAFGDKLRGMLFSLMPLFPTL